MQQTNRSSAWSSIFVILAFLFAVCVAVQVFLAGTAIFVDPARWRDHINFIHIFELLPILMLIVSFAGRLPAVLRWQSLGLFLLIIVMYATANMRAEVPLAGAFHPVNALLIFWLSVTVVERARKLLYPQGEPGRTSEQLMQ